MDSQTGQHTPAFHLYRGDAVKAYPAWPAPTVIMSDGAYGVRGFHGDTVSADGLAEWYRPHIEAWSKAAAPGTVLWFWNTEVGWASVHPILAENGWDYVQTVIWDKGIQHVAGNVNGDTIRRFPVVTEVVTLYQRKFEIETPDAGRMSVQKWLRHEWQRAGIPLNRANDACGVKNAATRKYLTQDWHWYWPPADMLENLAIYANTHGTESGWPYYSLDGQNVVTGKEWAKLRYKWKHVHGVTNVWQHPPLHSLERLRGSGRRAAPRVYNPGARSTTHLNQKPLELMRRALHAVVQPGDVVWEPFGGLATGSVAALELGCDAYTAELDRDFAKLAYRRLRDTLANHQGNELPSG
ncbi:DNA methyltransferase [Mycobacteroides abscessus]|uniref:Methyltransferase n=1 Tax=Mycobacteroides abscessus subsp. massiliense TaxID=1962118 RepID=A0A1U0ZS41_9MYCO|nr:DNA methyltransferase [Mycobacteroides abscessus]SKM29179.1 DNA adenine methyltransferase YhdJ [Mycobacteroides abscessus subsp. massiliense]SKT32469.1 DNA adenine methyltransferase YhdJ [Mycobacteroides abscessus subsp. massiliense]SKT69425.1 DNA adenine methyltransferase YhdJ [Mycobacteroides abscessus subsp. massiliense]SKX08608.1 DNA adenine methyltransferase YhdJ [Mycobacteroides abscessus subsp. massiliense]